METIGRQQFFQQGPLWGFHAILLSRRRGYLNVKSHMAYSETFGV